jgi:ADP-ribose pyrophosphatase YjhB (NUDIX family)
MLKTQRSRSKSLNEPVSSHHPHRDATGRSLADYPRPSVAVDTAVLTVPDGADALHVLLVRRAGSHEHGEWALPGTFLHPGETLADAVLRSLPDKAGVKGLAVRVRPHVSVRVRPDV